MAQAVVSTPVRRSVRIGGVSKPELLNRLSIAGVQLNEAAHALFADDRFTASADSAIVDAVEVSVAWLGFPSGATFAEVVAAAASHGLALCELELAAHLRLQFTDQPEGAAGQPPSRNRAPPGALTVASVPISEDDEVPKGFYLRRIDGVLWLRGYRSWADHQWSADDVFVFAETAA